MYRYITLMTSGRSTCNSSRGNPWIYKCLSRKPSPWCIQIAPFFSVTRQSLQKDPPLTERRLKYSTLKMGGK